MNNFVDYLNSTNNVGGNSTGSLAEMQVKSKYYDFVKVDRKLGTFITDCVQSGNHQAFILTGHAGDGKTSILVQVLKSLNRLQVGEGLEAEKEYPDFLYIKDMSEIAAGRQSEYLRRALAAPEKGKTSLLISNTGPLLKAFEELVRQERSLKGMRFTTEDQIELQSSLLSQLDINADKTLRIEGFSFTLVNIARVDNVHFSVDILKKILEPELWEPCQRCAGASKCPIKNNRDTVFAQFERVSAFIENFYRYLYENDKRMTIRQMVGQISYALTGNMTCEYVLRHHLREPHFNYNFANLFFGYNGLKPVKDSRQIKGIEEIRNLSLDHIALDVDYTLFVRQDYSCFEPGIQQELQNLTMRYRRHYQVTSEDQLRDEKKHGQELQLRCTVRRFYLMFSLFEDQSGLNHMLNQIFGTYYTDYCSILLESQSKPALNRMKKVVFEALYIKNTGISAGGSDTLPLTLRRDDDVFQNVMLILGEIKRSKLKITRIKQSNRFEDVEEKYTVVLEAEKGKFPLSLPMITYFGNMIDGAISSDSNPALTHGIAQLDALLLEQCDCAKIESRDDCSFSVIINSSKGQQIKSFRFDGEDLDIQG